MLNIYITFASINVFIVFMLKDEVLYSIFWMLNEASIPQIKSIRFSYIIIFVNH